MTSEALRKQDPSADGAVAAPPQRLSVHRELNEIEYFSWCLGQPYNIVVEVKLSGAVRPEALQAALHRAQVRHPLLGVNTEPGPSHVPWLSSEGVGPIPLTVIEDAAPDAATALLERELETPFAMDSAATPRLPLIRVALLLPADHPPGASLVITNHHMIADGLSILFLVRDLVRFIEQPEAPFEVADALVSSEELMPPAVRRRIPRSSWRFRVTLFLVRLWAPIALWLRPVKRTGFTHQRRSWTLTEAQTQRLVARCHQEGVSIHGAVCTAFLPDFPSIHTAVSVRGLLGRPVGEAVGNVVGSVMVSLRYRPGRTFWENAHRFQRKLRRGLRNAFSMYQLFSRAVPLELVEQLGPLLVTLAGKDRPFGITNLGRLDARAATLFAGSQLEIESFLGAMTPKFGASAMSVYTVRGRMRINLLAREPETNPTEIRDDSDRAIARLIAAIDT